MKKIISFIIAAVLVLSIAVPAFATGAPTILQNPTSVSVTEGGSAVFTVSAEGENLKYNWFVVFGGTAYDMLADNAYSQSWLNNVNGGCGPNATGTSFSFDGVGIGMNGASVYCVISNDQGSVTSSSATITVKAAQNAQAPIINAISNVEVYIDSSESTTLSCVAQSADGGALTYQWYETHTGKIQDIRAIIGEEAPAFVCDTESVGTRYYVCMVTNTKDGTTNSAYSNIVSVTVKPSAPPKVTDMVIQSVPSKIIYKIGDKLDLTGLRVRVWTTEGYMDLLNGEGVSVSPMTLTKEGRTEITVTYEGYADVFIVNVASANAKLPVIEVQPEDREMALNAAKVQLTVKAKSEDGGVLKYLWYSGLTRDLAAMSPIEGADSPTYEPEQIKGDMYYCVAIWNDLDGVVSEPVYSNIVKVTFTDMDEVPVASEDPEKPGPSDDMPESEEEDPEITIGAIEDDDDTKKKSGISIWWIIIPVIIILLAAGGAVYIFLYLKKNKEDDN